MSQLRTSGSVQGAHVGLYGVKWLGSIYLFGDAEYARFNNETTRFVDWVFDERASGQFNSDELNARVELGWQRSFGATNLTPFAGLRYANLWSDAFAERTRGSEGEPGILGLAYNSTSVSSLVSTLGIQLDTRVALANGKMFTPFLRVAWLHEFDTERGIDSFLTQSPTVGYAFNGASAVSDAAQVFAGAKLDLTQTIGVYGFFEGEFADRGERTAGFGGLEGESAGSASGSVYGGRVGMKVKW